MYSIRLICADSYQAAPIPDVDPTFSHFRGSDIKQVPILRIFGITSQGDKVCLHVHGVFPYMYVPYSGQAKADILAYQLAASLDAAINVSLGSAKANTQHVYKIQQVSGIPMYGYHRKKHYFFKIYFYNPAMMKRATDLLQSGSILEQVFQPHEAHIPYTLQFMMDYNIYGMSMINLRNVKHRHQSMLSQNEAKLSHSSNESLNPSDEKEYMPFTVVRQSVCELEMDVWASDIVNREVIDKGIDLNPGIAAIWEEEKARRAQADLGGDSQLTPPKSPERTQAARILTDNDVYQQQRLAQRLCIIESQSDTSLTPSSADMSYPIPVPENCNLLNASQLEIHAGPLDTSKNQQRSQNKSHHDTANDSLALLSLQSQSSFGDVSLNSSDLDVVDILANLAKEQEDNVSVIDSNSILGSQLSQKSCQDLAEEQGNNEVDAEDEEDEEEGVPDLNMTNIELDSLNFSVWESSQLNLEKSQPKSSRATSESQKLELVLESLNKPSTSYIPQLDGPIDDENARMGAADDEENAADVTLERKEFMICEYKRKRESRSVTPNKRKRLSSSEDDDSNSSSSTKRKKIKEQLPRTPRRSPSKRTSGSKLKSPSCPNRTYSPLSVQVVASPTTPKASPKTPSGRSSRTLRESLRRKGIFSPVKETQLEEEEVVEEIENLPSTSSARATVGRERAFAAVAVEDVDSNPDETSAAAASEKSLNVVESSLAAKKSFRKKIFSPVESAEQEASSDSNLAKPLSKASEELFASKEAYESDDTLVEDSDESLHTVTSSPPPNPVIINDSDSNDSTSSKDRLLSSYSFPQEVLPALNEEDEIEVSFSQMIEMRQKDLDSMNKSTTTTTDTSNPEEDTGMVLTLIPPSRQEIIDTMEEHGLDKYKNTQPFFSDQEDANAMQRYQVNRNNPLVRARGPDDVAQFRSCLDEVVGLEKWRKMKVREFHPDGDVIAGSSNLRSILADDEMVEIVPVEQPPSRASVEAWLEDLKRQKRERLKEEASSQRSEESCNSSTMVDPALSLSRIFREADGSKHMGVSCGQIEFNTRASINVEDRNLGNAKALATHQYLTIFCLEVHVVTRPGLLPDPKFDAIAAVFYAIHNDVPPDFDKVKPLDCGVIIAEPSKANNSKFANLTNVDDDVDADQQRVSYVEHEEDLFDGVLAMISKSDPEMLIGWDIEYTSWGYLFQRASILNKNLSGKISRIPKAKCSWDSERDQQAVDLNIESLAEVRLPGRIVLDIWKIMKYEIALTSYTYESVMHNVLNERIARYSYDVLANWWQSERYRWRVIDHYANKAVGVHRLLHHLDIINRTSEHARLYGVQFYEVFSRGSQFRVESMMLRLAKPLNYIPVSPSAHQRGCMRAPESLPLIMEPESTMYSDPVIVLDFQSLYPSIIIAYNYCFSTCLGRIEHIGSPYPFEFGCTTLKVPKSLATRLQNKVNFAPCGVAYVKQEVRQGILPRMLTEILETRLMVKKAIKDHSKDDRALQRALHSRQLGLKLIANVTYGYTAANFSGRMPCIEVGDSVVSKGKETLERAIKIVESTPKWGARVIYGDTDSLFVLLKGRSREEAFKIGAEIADVVTAANPKPVKLKFEKVMQPCILQTKKRYCGYMYENLEDEPVYLAKGIETVRRDGCPAVAKILEKTLRILFDTKDLSQVKQYVIRQLDKVLTGRASIQDLTFAKEFRGMRGYKAAACVPALELTRRLMQKDPRAIPNRGARVPYIIVAGGPNEPLIRCVKAPMELIEDPSLRPNATYYVTKVIIPPINRCLNLIGVDAFAWFMEMPHRQAQNRLQMPLANCNRKQKTTISQYLYNTTCPSCGQSCDKGICTDCVNNQTQTLITLYEKCRQYERIYSGIKMICESCIGVMDADSCTSLDCPIFYRRVQAHRDNSQVSYLYNLIQCMEHLT